MVGSHRVLDSISTEDFFEESVVAGIMDQHVESFLCRQDLCGELSSRLKRRQVKMVQNHLGVLTFSRDFI